MTVVTASAVQLRKQTKVVTVSAMQSKNETTVQTVGIEKLLLHVNAVLQEGIILYGNKIQSRNESTRREFASVNFAEEDAIHGMGAGV